ELRLVGLLDRALGTLVKVLARLGRGEAARRLEQQADAEAPFKLSDGLGDSMLSDAEQSRGGGERARFDDADEHLHRSQSIHGHSSKESCYRPERPPRSARIKRFKRQIWALAARTQQGPNR